MLVIKKSIYSALNITVISCIMLRTAMALSISPANTHGVEQSLDPISRTTIFTATVPNANLNITDIHNALDISNVSVRDNADQNITLTENSVINWSSPYSLNINAPQNVIIGDQAKFISTGYGNLILRADFTGNNEGTVILPSVNQLVINMMAGGSVKIFYRPKEYSQPTDFSSYVKVVAPGIYKASMAVNNLFDMQRMNQNLKGDYGLAKDIDAQAAFFSPVGTNATPFTGTFDGQGYNISNLTVSLPNIDYVGLFGKTSGATIQNVMIRNAMITGRWYVGGLIGFMDNGSVSYSSSLVDAYGNQSVGGLIGHAFNSARISQSYSEGSVNARNWDGGGLIGYVTQQINISDCYTLARVTNFGLTASSLGGLAGFNSYVTTRTSYAAGSVANSANGNSGGILGYASTSSNYQGTFWDVDRTGQTKAAGTNPTLTGVTGLPTDKMYSRDTYLNAGWDLNSVWGIDDGKNYPYLLWTLRRAPWTIMPTGPSHLNQIITG